MEHQARRFSSHHSSVTLLAIAAIAAACSGDPLPTATPPALLNEATFNAANDERALINELRAATLRFRSMDAARNAGYVEDTHCVEHPTLGGMGYHWVNNALVDPVFQPGRPEVLVYSPDQNGNVVLGAIEYIVIDVGQPRPTFRGYPFDIGGTPVPVPHWSLHVWMHLGNPSGMFQPFNPRVSCPST